MFITTANSLDTIPYPLLDRMEVIELSGYTNEEKLQIAKRYLVPKQIEQNGLTAKKIEFTMEGLKEIVNGYTMEAGVRNLERKIGKVVRKVATMFATNSKTKKQIITETNVKDYLGARTFIKDLTMEQDEVGTANGLAWTSVGGTTLNIEVSLMQGKGDITLTGKLGDVMKESATTALSYIRAHASEYGIDAKEFTEKDIHLHVPEGATPKDGPSAGITMATAILSAFTGKTVKKSVAMTGEITLRGKVLAIGGLREKTMAAYVEGIKTVVVPEANRSDLDKVDEKVKEKINFVFAKTGDDVLKVALV
jgi:ATP-dependent Lon protease